MLNVRADDDAAVRRVGLLYARCCDNRDGQGFAALFGPNAVLEGGGGGIPDFHNDTPEKIAAVPGSLNAFAKTYHTIYNTIIDIQGERATGEIYSCAHHLTPRADGKYDDFVMYITYHDRYARSSAGWRFAHRRVVIEFTERRVMDHVVGVR
jgi:hypothetical protein